MRSYPRVLSTLALAVIMAAGCADTPDLTGPEDASLKQGGIPAQPVGGADARAELLRDIPVSGKRENGEAFEGVFDITRLSRDGQQLLVSGELSWLDEAGEWVSETFEDVPATLSQTSISTSSFTTMSDHGGSGRCDVLFLDIGPIFLDLLGLEVDPSQIVLDITAVRGAGNLLGNLLCAVTGLLDPDSSLDRLLNRITGILGG